MRPIASLPPVSLWCLAPVVVLLSASSALAQPPGAPGAPAPGIPWQVAAIFTANWVLAAVAVAILSRPSKRPEKPKKSLDDDQQ